MFEKSAETLQFYYDNSLEFTISEQDKVILSELAKRVAELAALPEQDEKRELWYKHNALEETRPLILCDPENGWHEIITDDQFKCQGLLARKWEFLLRREIFWGESMGDDKPVENTFNIPILYTETNWGLEVKKEGGESGGAFHWDAPLKNYQEDLPKLHFPTITVDLERTNQLYCLAKETFGDILEIGKKNVWWWSVCSTDVLGNLRGMTEMMMDMYDYPDKLHQLSQFLTDGFLHRLNYIEEQGLLSLNNDGTYTASGGLGYSRELPSKGYSKERVTPLDMWGFAESQMTSEISSEMFGEFIMPYQIKVLERFGLNCYGCCEGIDRRWDYVKKIPRLRRVSVSPWAKNRSMAEILQNNYIYSRKPNPSYLSTSTINENNIRKMLKEDMQISKNCRAEYIMKDNHTLGNNPQNVIRWCAIAKEESKSL